MEVECGGGGALAPDSMPGQYVPSIQPACRSSAAVAESGERREREQNRVGGMVLNHRSAFEGFGSALLSPPVDWFLYHDAESGR